MTEPRLLVRRVPGPALREDALDLVHDVPGVVLRTDAAKGEVLGITAVAKPSISRVQGGSYRQRLAGRLPCLNAAFQRPDLGRCGCTLSPLPGDLSSAGADFLGVRAIGGIRPPALSPGIGGLHRFHQLIPCMA